MRADMAKVIVERPRNGGIAAKGRRAAGDIEDLPTVEAMRRQHGRTKRLSDHLSPLRRFLHSRIGRRWDEVYAETRAQIRPVSTVQQHILSHFFQWVAHRTRLVDGQVVVHDDRIWQGGPKRLRDCHFELYVHPVSRILLRNPFYGSWKRHRRTRLTQETIDVEARRRDLSPLRQLHKLRGLWFEVTLAAMPGLPAERPRDEVRDAGLSDRAPDDLYGRRQVYAAAKRQLNRRELKVHGLCNDAED